MSGSRPDVASLSSADGLALLKAVDDAFLQVLGTRFGGGVEAADVLPSGIGPRRILRPAPADNPSMLLLACQVGGAAAGIGGTHIPGLTIGSIARPASGSPDVTVQAEIYDTVDPNAHADGEPLGGGVQLHAATGMNAGSIDVIRTREQVAAAMAGGAARTRGQVPPLGRHGQRAALGLGGGSHRPALMAATRNAVTGRLLGRLGALLAQAGTIGPALDNVTLGLGRS